MDAFAKTDCCLTIPSGIQQLTTEYYKEIAPFIDGLMASIYQAEMYGKDTEELYNQVNNFHYLFCLLMLIYKEMYDDSQWNKYFGDGCEIDKGIEFYNEKYHLDCVKKKFFCTGTGYDISDAMDIFNLNPDAIGTDGIGYMSIQYTQSGCQDNINTFRIS